MSLDSLFPTCTVCGVAIRDVELHQRFHDALSDVARRIYAPDLTPEEWKQAVAAEAERQKAGSEPST